MQLPKAPKIATKSCTDAEKWAILLRDSSMFSRDNLPEIFTHEPYSQAVARALFENMTEEEIARTEKEQSGARDWASVLEREETQRKRADGEMKRADDEKKRADDLQRELDALRKK